MGWYARNVATALDAVRARRSRVLEREIADLRIVVFSDHHRGQRDGADDFLPAKPAYHAALGYYLEAGFELYLLGDVEELWESSATSVINAYGDTLALEREFAARDRLLRFFGNHDDLWADGKHVRKHLAAHLRPDDEEQPVVEGLRIQLQAGGRQLGEIFLTHGHQGSRTSDRFAHVNRHFVRYLWRPFQRLTHIRVNTPSNDFRLRKKHETAMYRWAKRQPDLILVAGHTHQPIFPMLPDGARLLDELEELRGLIGRQASDRARDQLQEKASQKAAELQWSLAHSEGREHLELGGPCYLNSGCCCYSSGVITAIEIDRGEIRLVRWPDDHGRPRRKVLQAGELQHVFENL